MSKLVVRQSSEGFTKSYLETKVEKAHRTGEPIFITAGLLKRLETEGQLAGVLGHEMATWWLAIHLSNSPRLV